MDLKGFEPLTSPLQVEELVLYGTQLNTRAATDGKSNVSH